MSAQTDFKSRINGQTFAYVDISFTIEGQAVSGITEINYESEREKENVYAAGSEPVGVTYGQRKYSASMSMLKSELAQLKKSAPNNRVEDIPPFDLPVCFINDDGTFVRDTIKNIEFTKVTENYKKGDKGLECKLDAICSGIVTTFS